MSQIRPTTAHIDLERLVHNLGVVRAMQPPNTKILCPVKGDAYGHGLVQCTQALEEAGADWFGVALLEEGKALRAAGVLAPILCLGGIGGKTDAANQALAHKLTPMVFDLDSAQALNEVARVHGQAAQVHLKVDTGMGRLGVTMDRWESFLDRLDELKWIQVQGLATHFASAKEDPSFTQEQARRFRSALHALKIRGHQPCLVHAANSAAATLYEGLSFDMVRPGLALYGHAHSTQVNGLLPVMQLSTEVLCVKEIPANTGVSYGRKWVSQRPTRLATLPVGYADGYPRALSNKAWVSIHGHRCPVRGTVCMDLCLVDVTDLPVQVRPGDPVQLMGDQIPAKELAAHAGTIVYEILTGLSGRVPRLHQKGQARGETEPG